jgi:hypothetical protein
MLKQLAGQLLSSNNIVSGVPLHIGIESVKGSHTFFSDRVRQIYNRKNIFNRWYKRSFIAEANTVSEVYHIIPHCPTADITKEIKKSRGHQQSSIIQSLRYILDERRRSVKRQYADLLDELDDDAFKDQHFVVSLREYVLSTYENVKREFSSVSGKLRAVAKAIASFNQSFDKRKILHKKNQVVFKQLDDEDHSK